jgi:hypothetical protein
MNVPTADRLNTQFSIAGKAILPSHNDAKDNRGEYEATHIMTKLGLRVTGKKTPTTKVL